MDLQSVTVVATYLTKQDAHDDVAALLVKHITATRGEPGCLFAYANQDKENPRRFVMFESYADSAAFESHVSSPHYEEYVANGVRPLLEDRDVVVVNPLV